tara:strand:- start:1438 stop:1617 length:180 start_codon:yes stop_codon:yes gene_type:complete
MLFRGKSGKLYEINKSDYLTEKEYNRAIMAVKFDVINNIKKPHDSKREIINIIKRAVSK